MTLERLNFEFTVCKVDSTAEINFGGGIYFIGKTDEEISLVCETADVPAKVLAREDGWRGFRIVGVLDFGMIGVLAKIAAALAENAIGIFVVSTYNTDYIFVKRENFGRAAEILKAAGYAII